MGSILTGTNGWGLRWALSGEWRVVMHADGGYSVNKRDGRGGWRLPDPETERIPPAVLADLLEALGVGPHR